MKRRVALSALSALLPVAIAACDGDIQLGGPSDAGLGGESAVDAGAGSPAADGRPLGSCTAAVGCGFDTLQCDVRGACVECRQDGDCRSGDRALCEGAVGRCVMCRGDSDCASEKRCELATHACIDRCSQERPCSRGTCDLPTGRCLECTPGAGCGNGKVCATTDVCVECASDTQCAGDKPHCDVLLARCVRCTSDAQCSTPERCELKSGECKLADH